MTLLLTSADTVERPALGWWLAITGGMGGLAFLALDPGAYAWWTEHVTAAFSRGLLEWILVLAIVIHVGEALVARRLARENGLGSSAGGWFWQTLLLGFPSLTLLRRRIERR
ncbi:MAG: DUF4499 domain-containing protein [Candidatus Binatia bacterium]